MRQSSPAAFLFALAVPLLFLLFVLGEGVIPARAENVISCAVNEDCSGYTGAFCGGDMCIAGICRSKPSPCTSLCHEKAKLCVECITAADCPIQSPQQVCDPDTHKCRRCFQHSDCPPGPFCYGGHWLCVSGGCVAPTPNLWPCDGNVVACDEEGEYCRECQVDSDCGEWNYCTNPRRCNTNTGLCVRDPQVQNCAADGLVCDPRGRRCVNCTQDSHCRQNAVSFCQPTSTCEMSSGRCYWNRMPPCLSPHPATGLFQTCSDERAACAPVRCLAGQDSECDDGNDCNGKEVCKNTLCYAADKDETHCPEGLVCDPERPGRCVNLQQRETLRAEEYVITCNSYQDCASRGLVCKIVSSMASDGTESYEKFCVPCKNHNQCQDGDASNGQEVCNPTTNRCDAGEPPCASAPPGMQFNPATQRCDLNVLTLDMSTTVSVKDGSGSSGGGTKTLRGPGSTGAASLVPPTTSIPLPFNATSLRTTLLNPPAAVLAVLPVGIGLLIIVLCVLGGFKVHRSVPGKMLSSKEGDEEEEEEEEEGAMKKVEDEVNSLPISSTIPEFLKDW